MCGIFFAYSPNQKVLNEIFANKDRVLHTIKYRGPDNISIVKDNNFIGFHTLLSITGYKEQPIITKEFVLLYNGEIYNDCKNYDADHSDTDYLMSEISTKGQDAFQYLDGEFAICLMLFKSKSVILATDPFGTKPLYYQTGPDFLIAGTYESTVSLCSREGPIKQVPANTLIELSLDNFKVKQTKRIRDFDFTNQTTNTFEKWNIAFTDSILKRASMAHKKTFVSLSSGHDAGVIAAELVKNNVEFGTYTVLFRENLDVVNERIKILKNKGVNCHILDITQEEFLSMKKFFHDNLEQFKFINTDASFQNFADPDMRNNPGCIASAIIHKKARVDGRLINLSGQGGDEIYADYYNEFSNPAMSELKGRWENVTGPWKNFYGGWNRVLLGGTERIAGLFGIETRYPLLDFAVVQEFINLHPKLKSRSYKSPITNRLIELGFPWHMKKFGFAGYDESKTHIKT